MSNNLLNKRVAIIGGGPGGLTLARLLQLNGVDVKVYERDIDATARVQGTTLDMHEQSGLKALRKAQLFEEFKKNYRPGADKVVIVNEQLEVFFSDHEAKKEEDFENEHFRPEIDRGPLRKMLLKSLKPNTVVWNSHFQSMQVLENGWEMFFANNNSAYADIVIGADGANSKIRPYLTSIKANYAGITAVEGHVLKPETTTPTIYNLRKGGRILAFGDGEFLGGSSKKDGSFTFLASCKADENWIKTSGIDFANKTQMLDWFKKNFANWSPIWHELFENAEMPFVPRPIYCMPLDQTWDASPNLTILGDAAHWMPPFAGEGANMAMLDAVELCECLCSENFTDLQAAITTYEIEMRARAATAAKMSLENGERMHSAGALEKMLAIFAKN